MINIIDKISIYRGGMMKDIRPDFKDIKSFEEFNRYYWYREELSQICKSLGLEYRCTKQELNYIIEQYFKGNKIEKFLSKGNKSLLETDSIGKPNYHTLHNLTHHNIF